MKLALAQIQSVADDIENNIRKHEQFVHQAVSLGADLVVFPELSITGYEPKLAKELATEKGDKRLDGLQGLSTEFNIIIAAGAPIKTGGGVQISMIIFQPAAPRLAYSKQHLHTDEEPYFVSGPDDLLLSVRGLNLTPAICYESLLQQHAEKAYQNGAGIYMASVAKAEKGIAKAFQHYPKIAAKYGMTILMVNSIGPSDDFIGAGQSAVWNTKGELIVTMPENEEGILLYDTVSDSATKHFFTAAKTSIATDIQVSTKRI
jgi:predicted amidohydrolase